MLTFYFTGFFLMLIYLLYKLIRDADCTAEDWIMDIFLAVVWSISLVVMLKHKFGKSDK